MQYVISVLPFLFTEVLFQETCLLFRSPTSITESFCSKMCSRSVVASTDVGGRYAATNSSLRFCRGYR